MSYQQPANMAEAHYSRRTPSANYNVPLRQPSDINIAMLTSALAGTHLNVPGGQPIPATTRTGHYFYTDQGQLVWTPGTPYQAPTGQLPVSENNFGGYPSVIPVQQYYPQAGYQSVGAYMAPNYSAVPYSPNGRGFYGDRQEPVVVSKDVPALENRRGSYSTNESAPGTPFYAGQREQAVPITVVDRASVYSTTPSPQTLASTHIVAGTVKPMPFKAVNVVNSELETLLLKHPAIPPAVPAVFTPRESMRTMEQSMINTIPGNRNVYIRGLHPNTDDDTLNAYCSRFGEIETSKAIIDTATGACKGFGFAKFIDVRDSENCIRGFFTLGYEVGFARELFNSRLKAEGDESSTNLYVSNLPKTMTESELGAVFMDYKVSSSRILRDNQGHSRGVGFARFEDRETCKEVIKIFHGQPIGEEGLLLQVRYADTPAQKDLKRLTTERRQWRTNEYNVGAYGTVIDGIAMSPTLSVSPIMAGRGPLSNVPISRFNTGSWKREGSTFGNTNGGGLLLKDVDRTSNKSAPIHARHGKEYRPSASTPTISEDGSNGSNTIHASPAATDGGVLTALTALSV